MITLGELLYGLRPDPVQTFGLYAWDGHADCGLSVFCRNPLHPGPCKGWKKHLGILSPGALHALEKIRHEKLEERRKAKVKALVDVGKPVPKSLQKPIVYDPAKNKHLQVDLNDPEQKKLVDDANTPISAPTKKDIEGKLDAKAQAKKAAEAAAVADLHALLGEKFVSGKKLLPALDKAPGAYEGLSDAEKTKISEKIAAAKMLGNPQDVALANKLEKQHNIPKWEPKVQMMHEVPESTKAPSAPAAPKAAVKAGESTYDTVKGMGLKDGDQVMLHVGHHTDGTKLAAGKATKAMTNPELVTVKQKKVIKNGGKGAYVVTNFVDKDGNEIPGGGPTAKYWMKPVDGKADVPSTPEKPGAAEAAKADAGLATLHKINQIINGKPLSDTTAASVHKGLAFQHTQGDGGKGLAFGEVDAKAIAIKLAGVGVPVDAAGEKKIADEINSSLQGGHSNTPLLDAAQSAIVDGDPTAVAQLADALKADAPAKHSSSIEDLAKHSVAGNLDNKPLTVDSMLKDVSKEDFDKLTPGQQAAIIEQVNTAHGYANAATKSSIGDSMAKLGHPIGAPNGGGSDASLSAPSAPHVKAAVDLASGAKSGTAKMKVATYGKLTGEDIKGIPPAHQQQILKDLQEAQAKFQDPAKKLQAKGIHDTLKHFIDGEGTALPVTNDAPTGEAAAKGLVTLAEHAGESSLPSHIDVASGDHKQAGQWLGSHAFNNGLAAAQIAPDLSVKEESDFYDSVEQQLAADYKAALDAGESTPGGLAGELPGIVAQANQAADDVVTKNGWPKDSVAVEAYKKAVFEGKLKAAMAGKPAGDGGSASAPPKEVADALKPAFSGALDDIQKGTIKQAYKSLTGSYLKDNTAEENLANLLAVAHVYSGQPGFPDLTFRQVAGAVDEAMAKDLNVPNAGMLTAKIEAFLKTPGGKAYADSLTPNAANVNQLTKSAKQQADAAKAKAEKAAKLAEFKKNNKHPVFPGPGAFDPTKKASDFKAQNNQQSRAAQNKLFEKLGIPKQSTTKEPYLTQEQYDAAYWYTGSGASAMNDHLRTGNGSIQTAMAAKELEEAMLPTEHDQLLWRRTGWEFIKDPAFRSPEGIKKLIGGTFDDEGFLSTTVAGQPGSYGKGLPVRLEIEAPKGTRSLHVQHFSQWPNENEVLLGSGQKYQILGVKTTGGDHGGQTVVRVRVVTP